MAQNREATQPLPPPSSLGSQVFLRRPPDACSLPHLRDDGKLRQQKL